MPAIIAVLGWILGGLNWLRTGFGLIIGLLPIVLPFFKSLLIFGFATLLPYVLKRYTTFLDGHHLSNVLSVFANFAPDGLKAQALNVSGLAGYIASVLRLPECFSVILSYRVAAFLSRKIT